MSSVPYTLTSLGTSFPCGSYGLLPSKKEMSWQSKGEQRDKQASKGVPQNSMVCRRHNIKIQQWALTPAQAVAWFSSKAVRPITTPSAAGTNTTPCLASWEGVFQHPQVWVCPEDNKEPLSPRTGCVWSPCSHRDIQPPLQSWVWPYSTNRELLQSRRFSFYQICVYHIGIP